MGTPTWEESVEKARIASLKTFEGRMEIASASYEQIPPHGKGGTHSYTLADFAEAVGLEYQTLMEYREVTKWWGDSLPQQRISWTFAREAMRAGKWRNGDKLIEFTLRTEPPAPFKNWTVDALRVHLDKRPTNTGKLALRQQAGEKVSTDQFHAAAALDHAEQAAEEIDEIKSGNERLRAGVEASRTISEKLPEPDQIFRQIDEALVPAPYEQLARMIPEIEQLLAETPDWLASHGRKLVDGEPWADICMDSLAESKGRLDIAFRNVGVGVSLDEEAETLLG